MKQKNLEVEQSENYIGTSKSVQPFNFQINKNQVKQHNQLRRNSTTASRSEVESSTKSCSYSQQDLEFYSGCNIENNSKHNFNLNEPAFENFLPYSKPLLSSAKSDFQFQKIKKVKRRSIESRRGSDITITVKSTIFPPLIDSNASCRDDHEKAVSMPSLTSGDDEV